MCNILRYRINGYSMFPFIIGKRHMQLIHRQRKSSDQYSVQTSIKRTLTRRFTLENMNDVKKETLIFPPPYIHQNTRESWPVITILSYFKIIKTRLIDTDLPPGFYFWGWIFLIFRMIFNKTPFLVYPGFSLYFYPQRDRTLQIWPLRWTQRAFWGFYFFVNISFVQSTTQLPWDNIITFTIYKFLLTEHTYKISQIFVDKNHSNLVVLFGINSKTVILSFRLKPSFKKIALLSVPGLKAEICYTWQNTWQWRTI